MRAGESKVFKCGGCARRFELSLEPGARGNPKQTGSVVYCPFCGANDLKYDADDVDLTAAARRGFDASNPHRGGSPEAGAGPFAGK